LAPCCCCCCRAGEQAEESEELEELSAEATFKREVSETFLR
jgi:hypothetical protein